MIHARSFEAGRTGISEQTRSEGLPLPAATLAIALITRSIRVRARALAHRSAVSGTGRAEDGHRGRARFEAKALARRISKLRGHAPAATPRLAQAGSNQIRENGTAEKLRNLRAAGNPYVSILGSMNDSDGYTSYLKLLQGAHSDIRLQCSRRRPKWGQCPF